jgi:hypothetical protein
MADIIRQNQIRQIRDEDNYYKAQAFQKTKAFVKGFTQNIIPAQVVDTALVSKSKGGVNNLILLLNEIYNRLRIFDENDREFTSVLSNSAGSEYRKFISLINVVKIFQMWEELVNDYINPKINESTREGIRNNFQKISSYLKNITNYLKDLILEVCYIYDYKILSKDIADGEDLDILKIDLYNYIYPNSPIRKIIDKKDDEEDDEEEDDNNIKRSKFEEKINDLKEIVDSDTLIKSLIESLGFFNEIEKQIKSNNFKNIDKSELAFSIIAVINSVYTEFKNLQLQNDLIDLFEGMELPLVAPFFNSGFGTFKRNLEELDAMEGKTEPAEPVGEAGEGEGGEEEDDEDYYSAVGGEEEEEEEGEDLVGKVGGEEEYEEPKLTDYINDETTRTNFILSFVNFLFDKFNWLVASGTSEEEAKELMINNFINKKEGDEYVIKKYFVKRGWALSKKDSWKKLVGRLQTQFEERIEELEGEGKPKKKTRKSTKKIMKKLVNERPAMEYNDDDNDPYYSSSDSDDSY